MNITKIDWLEKELFLFTGGKRKHWFVEKTYPENYECLYYILERKKEPSSYDIFLDTITCASCKSLEEAKNLLLSILQRDVGPKTITTELTGWIKGFIAHDEMLEDSYDTTRLCKKSPDALIKVTIPANTFCRLSHNNCYAGKVQIDDIFRYHRRQHDFIPCQDASVRLAFDHNHLVGAGDVIEVDEEVFKELSFCGITFFPTKEQALFMPNYRGLYS